jgi:hypothetical protein
VRSRSNKIVQLLIEFGVCDLFAADVIRHAIVGLVIGPHDFIGARVNRLPDLRANPRFKLWLQALKGDALISWPVATIGGRHRDPARIVREAQAILVLVAVLPACSRA